MIFNFNSHDSHFLSAVGTSCPLSPLICADCRSKFWSPAITSWYHCRRIWASSDSSLNWCVEQFSSKLCRLSSNLFSLMHITLSLSSRTSAVMRSRLFLHRSVSWKLYVTSTSAETTSFACLLVRIAGTCTCMKWVMFSSRCVISVLIWFAELAELPLVRLDFSCNKVTTIPVCYRNLRHLQSIILDNNPLQCPPAQVTHVPVLIHIKHPVLLRNRSLYNL